MSDVLTFRNRVLFFTCRLAGVSTDEDSRDRRGICHNEALSLLIPAPDALSVFRQSALRSPRPPEDMESDEDPLRLNK